MIDEIVPGLVHWDAFHPTIRRTVYSAFDLESGTLIDPMAPAEGLDAVAELAVPRRIVLTNRHHYRDSDRYIERFGCPVLCHQTVVGQFSRTLPVGGFRFDEQLATDVRALELGAICPEETTVLLDTSYGVLCFGDGVTRDEQGSLAFMPDGLLGEEPAAVRGGLAKSLRRMLDEDFDALLFAHAEPVLEGGRELLEELIASVPGARV